MKSKHIFLLLACLLAFDTYSQEKKEGFFKKHPFVNMTEMGVLIGRNKIQNATWWGQEAFNPTYSIQNRVNASLQTFNGIYINEKTAVGLTVGVDGYGETVLMPISAGIRHNLVQRKQGGSILLGSLDAGYATTWLNEDQTNFRTEGGLVLSPTIGYKFPMRNSSAWLLNFGYRYQHAKYIQENTQDFYEYSEKRNYRRFMVRFGIEF